MPEVINHGDGNYEGRATFTMHQKGTYLCVLSLMNGPSLMSEHQKLFETYHEEPNNSFLTMTAKYQLAPDWPVHEKGILAVAKVIRLSDRSAAENSESR